MCINPIQLIIRWPDCLLFQTAKERCFLEDYSGHGSMCDLDNISDTTAQLTKKLLLLLGTFVLSGTTIIISLFHNRLQKLKCNFQNPGTDPTNGHLPKKPHTGLDSCFLNSNNAENILNVSKLKIKYCSSARSVMEQNALAQIARRLVRETQLLSAALCLRFLLLLLLLLHFDDDQF